MQTDRLNFSANILKRFVAFIMDGIIAFLPAFIMIFIFTGNVTHKAPLFYPCPLIGGTTLAITLPVEVNDALNTENGIYLFNGNSSDQSTQGVQRNYYNVSFWATSLRIISVLCVVFYIGYAAFCTVLYDGKTVGKKLMGIRVIHLDKQQKLTKALIIREVIGKIVVNSIPIVPVISIFTILFTPKHQAIHDIIAKTQAVE